MQDASDRDGAETLTAGDGEGQIAYKLRLAQIAAYRAFEERVTGYGKAPRYLGLLLTLILVLFMMGVAAWASIFMSDEVSDLLRPDARTQIAGNAPESPPT